MKKATSAFFLRAICSWLYRDYLMVGFISSLSCCCPSNKTQKINKHSKGPRVKRNKLTNCFKTVFDDVCLKVLLARNKKENENDWIINWLIFVLRGERADVKSIWNFKIKKESEETCRNFGWKSSILKISENTLSLLIKIISLCRNLRTLP